MADLREILDPQIRRRLELLPENFYGRVTLLYERGRILRMEITESIKPQADYMRAPLAK